MSKLLILILSSIGLLLIPLTAIVYGNETRIEIEHYSEMRDYGVVDIDSVVAYVNGEPLTFGGTVVLLNKSKGWDYTITAQADKMLPVPNHPHLQYGVQELGAWIEHADGKVMDYGSGHSFVTNSKPVDIKKLEGMVDFWNNMVTNKEQPQMIKRGTFSQYLKAWARFGNTFLGFLAPFTFVPDATSANLDTEIVEPVTLADFQSNPLILGVNEDGSILLNPDGNITDEDKAAAKAEAMKYINELRFFLDNASAESIASGNYGAFSDFSASSLGFGYNPGVGSIRPLGGGCGPCGGQYYGEIDGPMEVIGVIK